MCSLRGVSTGHAVSGWPRGQLSTGVGQPDSYENGKGRGTAGAEVWAVLRHYALVEKQRASWTWGPWPDQLQEHLREFLEGVQVKGCVQEALQLCQVGFLVASGWSSCWVSASIPERPERGSNEDNSQRQALPGLL